MVSPLRRRQAARVLQDRLGLSQRRACQVVGQSRSLECRSPAVADLGRDLRTRLRGFAKERPR